MAHGRRPLSLLVAMVSRRRCNALRLSQEQRAADPLRQKWGVFIGGFGRPPSCRVLPLPIVSRLWKAATIFLSFRVCPSERCVLSRQ